MGLPGQARQRRRRDGFPGGGDKEEGLLLDRLLEKGFPGGPVPVQGAAGDAGLLSDGVESGSPDPLSSQDGKGSCIDPGPGAGLTRIKTPPGLLHHTIMQQKCCTVPPTHTGPPAPARCWEGSPL